MSTGVATVPKVSPQTIGGPLNTHNRKAFDWSWQGPVAFGCQNFVVVVEPHTAQRLQTLVHHKAHVTKVCWGRQVYHCTLATPSTLRLASVDTSGQCVVWDVGTTTPISEFSVGTRPFVDLQWLATNDSCRDLLAVLLSPGTMTIWNADTGTRISRFTFTETITAFTFNPFQTEQLVLLSQECFIFVNDFTPLRPPTGGGKKLYMSMPQDGGGLGVMKGRDTRQLVLEDNERTEDNLSLVDCLQIQFCPSNRHHLLLLYAREILVIDTEIMQAVGSVYLERGSSPFLHFASCWQRDAIYCLHENGCVSFRVRQHIDFPSCQLTSAEFLQRREVVYVLQCHSDPLRISKSSHVYALAVCPTTELRAALLTSEGKVVFLDAQFDEVGVAGNEDTMSDRVTLLGALPLANGVLSPDGGGARGGRLTLHHSIAPYWFNPPDGGHDVYPLLTIRLVMTGVYYGLIPSPTSLRMCPPLTTKNIAYYRALVAVGGANGVVQVFDLTTQQLYKEITVHTCPVRGLEWLSHNMLLSYAHPTPNSSGQVRNELAATHLDTGMVLQLKRSEASYQPPITCIRVSPHKNYFFVNFKDSPPHFYDARTLSFIKELDAKPAVFVTVEWANSVAFPSIAKARSQPAVPVPNPIDAESGLNDASLRTQENRTSTNQPPEKEVITLVDGTSNIHHLIVNKSGFELGPHKSVQSQLNSPTAMTWKGDVLVLGDSMGTLMMWEVIKGSVKYVDTPRAVVRKLKFGPGKGNRRIMMLFSNRLEIRDVTEDNLVGQLRWGRDNELSIEEVDWCASDKPVCLMSDGSLRVFDIKLSSCTSPHNCADYNEPVFCPHAVLPQAAFRLKCVLQHQVWNIEYSLDYTEVDSTMDPIERAMASLLQSLPLEYREQLLKTSLGTPYRSLITALLFGDEREICFWFVALYHILREKQRRQDHRYLSYQYYIPSRERSPTHDIIRPDSHASTNLGSGVRHSLEDLLNVDRGDGQTVDISMQDLAGLLQESNRQTWALTPPLDLSFDFLCDQDVYRRFQLFRALCHDSRRHKPSQTRKCGETMLLLGQTDRAVQLLLETDAGSSEYYVDALKACLAATIRSSGVSQSTIKLVATNLIASSHLMEGAQLLCLIDKGIDACRYMQSYGEWTRSVWLARSILNEREAIEVLSRWADHLASPNINKKNLSLLVLLSVGQFMKVVETLYSMRYFDQAAVFLESCLEYGLIKRNEETSPLIEAVFLEYARYLDNLGLKRGMRYYCNLAGEKGQQLMEEYFSPHRRHHN